MSTSPFPRWLHHLDPTLATAGENALYMAFRERRLTYPPRLRFDPVGTIPRILILIALAGWIFCIAAAEFGTRYFPNVTLTMIGRVFLPSTACFLLGSGIVILRHIRREEASKAPLMPHWAGRVYTGNQVESAAAGDLWLCGYTAGQEIAEAVYLETWESVLKRIHLLFPVIMLATALLAIYRMGISSGRAWLMIVLFEGLACALSYAALAVTPLLAFMTADSSVEAWKKQVAFRRFLSEAVLGLLLIVPVCYVIIATSVSFRALIVPSPDDPELSLALLAGGILGGAALFLLTPWLLRPVFRFLREMLFRHADRYYEPMMRKVVFNDPDFDKPLPSPQNRPAGS